MLLVAACSTRVPDGILKPEKFTQVLTEMHRLDAMREQHVIETPDQLLDDPYLMIFEKYGIDKATVDSSIAWYWRHPKEFLIVYDSVLAHTQREVQRVESERAGNRPANANADGDEVRHKPKR